MFPTVGFRHSFWGVFVLRFDSVWCEPSTHLVASICSNHLSSKNAHPLLICSSVRTALSFFSCFFFGDETWLAFSLVFKSLIERATAPVFHLEGVLPWWDYIHSSGNKKQWTWISYPKNHGISKLVSWRSKRTLRHSRVKPLYWEGAMILGVVKMVAFPFPSYFVKRYGFCWFFSCPSRTSTWTNI